MEKKRTRASRVPFDPLYFWVSKCLFKGRRDTLTNEDLPALPRNDHVDALAPNAKWADANSVSRMVFRSEGGHFVFAMIMQLIMAFMQTLQSVLVITFIAILECRVTKEREPLMSLFTLTQEQCGKEDSSTLLALCFAIPACAAVAALCNHMAQMITFNIGQRIRSMIIALVFNKILVLRGVPETGEALNLVSNDAQRWIEAMPLLNHAWSGPLQIIASCYFTYTFVGPAAFLTIGTISLVVPVSAFLTKQGERIRRKHLKLADERLRLCTEMLYGSRVMKYFVWEKAYTDRIAAVRQKELREAYKQNVIFGFTMVFTVLGPFIAVGVTLVYFTVNGNESADDNKLTAVRAFGVMNFAALIRFPIMQLGHIIASLSALSVSVSRSNKFFMQEEQVPMKVSDSAVVSLTDAAFGWKSGFATTPVSFKLLRGKICALFGPVGSGKTTFLRGILGDATLLGGECELMPNCKIAYVPQSPWVFNATLRDNVVFGRPFDEQKFANVMQSSCLWDDCNMLVDRELTEVGERGVTLSGGQKMRVSIARALYGECDLLVLDDIYAALDAETGRTLHSNIAKYIEAVSATVIFTTNSIAFATESDIVLTFKRDGGIGLNCVELNVAATSPASRRDDDNTPATDRGGDDVPLLASKKADALTLTTAEERASGTSFSRYAVGRYISAFGGWHLLVVLILLLNMERAVVIASDVWVADWRVHSWFLLIYIILLCSAVFFVVLVRMIFPILSIRSARTLFRNMVVSVVRAPMEFFDTTPMGRVLNRMSFDTENLDVTLLTKLFPATASLSWMLGSLVVLSWTLFPYFFIALPIIAMLYGFLFQLSRRSIRDIQRLDNINRSPIASLLGETLDGIHCIRAYKAGERYIARLADCVNTSARSILTFVGANRWLGVRLELLGATITLFACIIILLIDLPAEDAGLALLWAMTLSVSFSFNCLFWSLAEAAFTSVERVATYGDIPAEGEHSMFDAGVLAVDDARFAKESGLVVENIDFRYRTNLPRVLSKLSFVIEPGKRCAVVGRTGAGKSSIAVALFRLVQPESGSITLNGVNLLDIPVDQARLRLGIITQDPVVFGATVRYNLDPFQNYADDALWEALRHAQLESVFSSLDTTLAQQGANLSVGQRQLLSLARTILRQPALLICDEATASCDYDTDRQIQKSLRTWAASSGASLLTIAHRLETIADYDEVLVMDEGRVVESGNVLSLLEADGKFARLVQSAGDKTAKIVMELAQAKSGLH